jgi:hypothetical protein
MAADGHEVPIRGKIHFILIEAIKHRKCRILPHLGKGGKMPLLLTPFINNLGWGYDLSISETALGFLKVSRCHVIAPAGRDHD